MRAIGVRVAEGLVLSGNDDLIAKLPMARIAAELGVDGSTASATVRLTLPALLTGMKANAADPRGAASLGKAVSQHAPAEPIGATFDLNLLNPVEGAKIVANVFGQNTEAVIMRLAGSPPVAAAGTALTRKALNILAPIVLTYLNQAYVESQRPTPAKGPVTPPPPSPSAVQELLDRLVPAATAAASSTAAATAAATANATAAATAAVRAATPRPSEPLPVEPAPVEEPQARAAVEVTPGPPNRVDVAALAGSVGGLLSGLLGQGRKS